MYVVSSQELGLIAIWKSHIHFHCTTYYMTIGDNVSLVIINKTRT
jgi:hypothetical protein